MLCWLIATIIKSNIFLRYMRLCSIYNCACCSLLYLSMVLLYLAKLCCQPNCCWYCCYYCSYWCCYWCSGGLVIIIKTTAIKDGHGGGDDDVDGDNVDDVDDDVASVAGDDDGCCCWVLTAKNTCFLSEISVRSLVFLLCSSV